MGIFNKKAALIIVFSILIFFSLFLIWDVTFNKNIDSNEENENFNIDLNENSNNDLVENIKILNIDAINYQMNIANKELLGVEYQLHFELPSKYISDHLGSKLGFQLEFPKEISNILGCSGTGTVYGFEKKSRNEYVVKFIEAGSSINEEDLKILKENANNISVNIYFEDKSKRNIRID